MIALSKLLSIIHLRSRPLQLIRDILPKVALTLCHRIHKLLRHLRRLQIILVYLRGNRMAQVVLELRRVVEVLDALLARLAKNTCSFGVGVLVRVAQVHVVFGVEADFAHGGGNAGGVADEAAVDCGVGEGCRFAFGEAFLVEEAGDFAPEELLILAEGLDEDVFGVFFDEGAGAGLLVLRHEYGDVVLDFRLGGFCALESVHDAIFVWALGSRAIGKCDSLGKEGVVTSFSVFRFKQWRFRSVTVWRD